MPLVSTEGIIERWREYFENLLNTTGVLPAEEAETEDTEMD